MSDGTETKQAAIGPSTPVQAKLFIGFLVLAASMIVYEQREMGSSLRNIQSDTNAISGDVRLLEDRQSRIREDVAVLRARLEQSGYVTTAALTDSLRTIALEIRSEWQQALSRIESRLSAVERSVKSE